MGRTGVVSVVVLLVLAVPATARAEGHRHRTERDDVPPALELSLARAAFSPNGDGRADVVKIHVGVDEPVALSLTVRTRSGDTVRTLLEDLAVEAGTTTAAWDGTADDGSTAPDGREVVLARAVDAAGNATEVEAPLLLDTRPPVLAWTSAEPDPFRADHPLLLSFTARDLSPVVETSVVVRDLERRGVAHLRERVPSGEATLRWDGRTDDGRLAEPGVYLLALGARDEARNVAAPVEVRIRDHRPVHATVIRRVDGSGPRVALTFDDCWDGAAWSQILSTLEQRHAGGSFFCLGQDVARFPDLARRTVADGFTIGGHGWDHTDVRFQTADELRGRVRREADTWWSLAGASPVPFFRPPGGAIDADARSTLGAEGFRWIVLWDVDPWDWSDPGADAVQARVLDHVRAGSIVVLHTLDGTAAALPGILRGLRARGLEPVTLAELLDA